MLLVAALSTLQVMPPSDSGFDNVLVPVVEVGLNPTVVEDPVVDQHQNVNLLLADQQTAVSVEVNPEDSITEVAEVEKENNPVVAEVEKKNNPVVAEVEKEYNPVVAVQAKVEGEVGRGQVVVPASVQADLALVPEGGHVAERETVLVPARRVGSIEPYKYTYSRRNKAADVAAVVPDEVEGGKVVVVGGVEKKPLTSYAKTYSRRRIKAGDVAAVVPDEKSVVEREPIIPYGKTYSRRKRNLTNVSVVSSDVTSIKAGLASGEGQVSVDAELGFEKPTVEAEKVSGTSGVEKGVAALQDGQVCGKDDHFIQELFVPGGPVDKKGGGPVDQKGVQKHVLFTRKMNQAAQGPEPAQEPEQKGT